MESSESNLSCPMTGGDGPTSYAQNSAFQKGVIDAAKRLIFEGIRDKLDFKNPSFRALNTFTMADFGCSSGTNTFTAMQNIIEAINLKHHDEFPDRPPLDFHVFFNDQTENDFNNLFKTLPTYQNYFAAGVPGSFHKRQFPKSFLHFAYSSYALHWLSVIPKEIMDKTSPAWNKGIIYCSGSNKEVSEAYSTQFKTDMDKFLSARAEEIVVGGLMVILIAGLQDGAYTCHTRLGKVLDILGSCLLEMAKMGVANEEKVDSFNVPMYLTSAKELEEIIKTNGYFNIERMNIVHNLELQKKSNVVFIAQTLRAMYERVLKDHFGDETIVEKIFQCFRQKLGENHFITDEVTHPSIDLFILLKRKSDS